MYSIGEFSRITGLTVKTLRFYHEKQLLIPARVEPGTSYRSYGRRNVETARVIVALRKLEFPLEQIAEILNGCEDDVDLLDHLRTRRDEIAREIESRRDIARTLDAIITQSQTGGIMNTSQFQVEEKQVEPVLVGGIRMRGRYSDCGDGFRKLGRSLGRHISGKAMMLCYDGEYRENDADFEVCMPVRRSVKVEGVDVRELPGGRAVSLLHQGPYDEIGGTYQKLFEYLSENGLKTEPPCREIYVKGPGMIFKGNPQKYLTEVQLLVAE